MMDALDGLAALEQVVETIGEQLDDLYQRRDIPQIERVTLRSLEWTLAKLNDDLHTMETEVRDLRLAEAAARRGASEAQQKLRDEQLQSLSVFNELRWQLSQVTAERDAARQQHLIECRKYNAEVERRLALEKQVAELTKKASNLGVQQLTPRQVEISDSTGTDGEGQP